MTTQEYIIDFKSEKVLIGDEKIDVNIMTDIKANESDLLLSLTAIMPDKITCDLPDYELEKLKLLLKSGAQVTLSITLN